MGRQPTKRDPHEGLRRFLNDLRATADRRSKADRRLGEAARRGAERRTGSERRVVRDRRQPVFATYSLEDVDDIREMIRHPKVRAACPECDANMMLGPPFEAEGHTARRVQCTGCRRRTILKDIPDAPAA